MKVLIVENSLERLHLAGGVLAEPGYSVDSVADADRAIELAAKRSYDAVILDLIPPRETSLRVLHEVRESDDEVRILILTERDQIHDRVTALIQGADDYLVKPISLDELNNRIRKLLRDKIDLESNKERTGNKTECSEKTSKLIANLLDHCTCDRGPIELVISTVNPVALLHRACADLTGPLDETGVRFNLPDGKMPTLLCDAGLMHRLLVKLLLCAFDRCPGGKEIVVGLSPTGGSCAISIESPLVKPLSDFELRRLFRDLRPRKSGHAMARSPANLSLARNYAERMNLNLQASMLPNDRFNIELSNIKVA